MTKRILIIAAFALIAIAMIWVRVVVGAQTEFSAGESALSQGRTMEAVHHYDRAIHWYSPGSSPVIKSISALKKIADGFESEEDRINALYTWRVLRSALYSARHVFQPYPDIIAGCDEKIATLMALGVSGDSAQAFEAEKSKRLEQLQKKVGPNTGFALLAQAGFLGWVACAFLFIWFAIKPEKGIYPKRAALFSLLFVVFYFLWIIGLSKA